MKRWWIVAGLAALAELVLLIVCVATPTSDPLPPGPKATPDPVPSVAVVELGALCTPGAVDGLSTSGSALICARSLDGRFRWQGAP